MAVENGITIDGRRDGPAIDLVSDGQPGRLRLPLPFGTDPAAVQPAWGRYVAGVAQILKAADGFTGHMSSTLPAGSGLSSSAAVEVAVAAALRFDGSPEALARAAQEAEHVASGVPCGIMDQLASVRGVAGHALLIDCRTLEVIEVPVPDDAEIRIIPSGQARALAESEYAERRLACEAAARLIGPLRDAQTADVESIVDPTLRARARHVVTENLRVLDFAAALTAGDLDGCGRLMAESHGSLARDFEVSTDRLDQLVSELNDHPDVYGARLTGAGFGGCAVALCRPGRVQPGWAVRPGPGAWIEEW